MMTICEAAVRSVAWTCSDDRTRRTDGCNNNSCYYAPGPGEVLRSRNGDFEGLAYFIAVLLLNLLLK